jgi:hypothetical protein
LSIADVATFLVSLVLGFGGNVTASSDKSDQKFSENDFIKSFSESPTFKFWDMFLKTLDSEESIDNAVYHSGCITKYLLRYTPVKSKFQEDDCPEFSVHDYDFKMLPAVATTCPIDTSLLKTRLNFPCPRCICTTIESP